MTADLVRVRTTLLLLRSFGPANLFILARLLGVQENEAARILAGLARNGLANELDQKWILTSAGRDELKPDWLDRPGPMVRWRRGRRAGSSRSG
jgi:hypothetical protein